MALDLNNLYQELSEHVYHDLSCVAYVGPGSTEYDNVAIECNDCGIVLFDADRPTEADPWTPEYERWRHGGWYVTNIIYPSGACGCVSRNWTDKKWRIVCDPREGSYPGGPNDHTYPNRDAAARAEKLLAESEVPVASS